MNLISCGIIDIYYNSYAYNVKLSVSKVNDRLGLIYYWGGRYDGYLTYNQ